MYEDRILNEKLRSKVMSADEAAQFIKSGMVVASSGFATGFPRAVPAAVAKAQTAKDVTLIFPAGRGDGLLGVWARAGVTGRYYAFQINKDSRAKINDGHIKFADYHLGQVTEKIRTGYFGHIDCAICEISKIDENGNIIPGVAGGSLDTIIEAADKVILEINLALPNNLDGLHDFHIAKGTIFDPADISKKVGLPYIKCDPDKIAAIVFNNEEAHDLSYSEPLPSHKAMARIIVDFIKDEIKKGSLPEDFTFQCGTGLVINSVLGELFSGGFKNLKMFTEILSDQAMQAVLDDVISAASTTGIDLSAEGYKTMFANIDKIKEHVAVRNVEFTNGSGPISNCNLLALNGAVECDIYGNVNSSHAFGTNIINGIGGSNDFCRNAKVSIFSTVSTTKKGAVSRIVPMVSHVDSTEHDVDVIVTEWGIADLRGLSPKERVPLMINLAHPDYRQQLWDYYNGALEKCGPCQTPHDLSKAFSMYERYEKTGTMKE